MRVHKVAEIASGAVLAARAVIGLRAVNGVLACILPGLSRQSLDGRVEGRKDGGVGGKVVEERGGGLLEAREGGECGESALRAKDIAEGHGALDLHGGIAATAARARSRGGRRGCHDGKLAERRARREKDVLLLLQVPLR